MAVLRFNQLKPVHRDIPMTSISRRDFLARTAAAAGAAALAGPTASAAETSRNVKSGTDIVTLGKTGIQTNSGSARPSSPGLSATDSIAD